MKSRSLHRQAGCRGPATGVQTSPRAAAAEARGPDSRLPAIDRSPRSVAQRRRISAAFGDGLPASGASSAVVQMVPAGSYMTTGDGHLRNEAREEVMLVKKGTRVDVIAPVRSSKFALRRWGSRSKDHTWVHCAGKAGWIRDGVLGSPVLPQAPVADALQEPKAPVEPASTVPRTAYTPTKAVSIAGHKTRKAAVRAESSGEDVSATSLTPLPEDFPALNKVEVAAPKKELFARVRVYVHFTKAAYRKGIHLEGLQPGKKQGIGLATDDGQQGVPDAEHVYVLSRSAEVATKAAVAGEAGPAPVAVISRNDAPDKDVNYPRGAYRFHGAIAPGRRPGGDAAGSISLVLPLTPSGRAGLASFLNEGIPDQAQRISAEEAEVLLARELFQQYPLRFRSYRGL